LEIGVCRPDLADMYPVWINTALRAICRDRSWYCMKHTGTVTILSGNSSAALPADFKEFTPTKPAVWLSDGTRFGVPCDVVDRDNVARFGLSRSNFPVYLDNDEDGVEKTLNVLGQPSDNLVFTFSYYRFLPDLEFEASTNSLLTNYPEMLKAKVKAVAFEELNDPLSVDWETVYARRFREAAGDDEKRKLSSRLNRMGG
jgi:hypothetical protein